MVTVIAFKIQLPDEFQFLANSLHITSFLATVFAWLIIGVALYFLLKRMVPLLSHWIPGEIDDAIIAIFAKPTLWVTFVFGSLSSITLLNLPARMIELSRHIFNSVLVLIIAYLVWKLLHDVVFYYGREWVQKTESRVDDTIMPLTKLFGSIVLVLIVAIVILTIWGVNITSALIGAGLLSLIIGLALQDTLKNIFGGLSLLTDAPFVVGDLITMSGQEEKVFRVESIGLRATKLHRLAEHSTVYVPNSEITKSIITNRTRPTLELRTAILVRIAGDSDLSHVKEVLRDVAIGFPCVVASIPEKISRMTKLAGELRDKDEKVKFSKMIERLKAEQQLDNECLALAQSLKELASEASSLEKGGYTIAELQKLQDSYIQHANEIVDRTVQAAQNWIQNVDPYLEDDFPEEALQEQIRYRFRNGQLTEKWAKVKSVIREHELGKEMRFDDECRDFAQWIEQEYKSFFESWKGPDILLERLERYAIVMTLSFFIDDARLEHNERRERVTTDLAIAIHEKLQREGIKLA